MRFENITMVWAFLAVLLPILIYYLFKRRFETYSFGAMTVLRLALAKRKDRVLIEQMVMIATRVLLLAFLACAMLQPVIGRKASETRPSSCMALLFDNSYSMLAGEDISRLERAKFIGANLMDFVESRDEVYISSAADPKKITKLRPFRNGAEAKAAIQALPPAWKPRRLIEAMHAAGALLAHSKCERRELFIFTD